MIVEPEFDPAEHRYSYKGMHLLSVTQVLKLAGILDDRFYTPGSAEMGRALHVACEFDDQDDLVEESIDPSIMGRVRAWRKFRQEMQPKFTAIEIRLAKIGSPSFAGMFDRECLIRGQRFLLDIKGGAPEDWHSLQLSGYSILRPGCRLANVYLRENETYRFIEREVSFVNQETFIAAARVAACKFEAQKSPAVVAELEEAL